MNIKDAKEEIKRTLRAYTAPGSYRIPPVHQRPILLIGPPGIGKTAILEQVAEECNVGLVSYTMTHHTRQSAIGLPFIVKKDYQGEEHSVTEYTMSEIIASVYDCMEKTGCTRGILFIDEINCVSETLTPVMLQFLQNKTFGNHPVPKNWLIVAAGNPPEYNQSVREFDIVTMDRVKYMEIEADLPVWRDYAREKGIHPAIQSYLALHPDHFYALEQNANGKHFVTARGWEDLSCILFAYEALEERVTEGLFFQYLRQEAIARSFSVYYRLYESRKKDVDLAAYLSGTSTREQRERLKAFLKNAPSDELFGVTSLISDSLFQRLLVWKESRDTLKKYREFLSDWHRSKDDLTAFARSRLKSLNVRRTNGLLSISDAAWEQKILEELEDVSLSLRTSGTPSEEIHVFYQKKLEHLKTLEDTLLTSITGAYALLEASSAPEPSILYLTTELTRNPTAAEFLGTHPVPPYLDAAGRLLLSEREAELKAAIRALDSKHMD